MWIADCICERTARALTIRKIIFGVSNLVKKRALIGTNCDVDVEVICLVKEESATESYTAHHSISLFLSAEFEERTIIRLPQHIPCEFR